MKTTTTKKTIAVTLVIELDNEQDVENMKSICIYARRFIEGFLCDGGSCKETDKDVYNMSKEIINQLV